MTDWRSRFREADRALDPGPTPAAAQQVRRAVLASVRDEGRGSPAWSRGFVAAAATLALVCVALLTALNDLRLTAGVTATTAEVNETGDGAPPTGRQQLQFSTPGGTRIIWVFDPGFEVKGTLP